MVGSIFLREKEGGKEEKGKRERGEDTGYIVDIHCGVVGNIQAFHVCAPGSIPGDGVFCRARGEREKGKKRKERTPTIAQLVERRTVVENRIP